MRNKSLSHSWHAGLYLPSQDSVEVGEETTDDSTAQVTGVERLSNVGRRELDDNGLLALGRIGRVLEASIAICAIGRLLGQDTAQNGVGQRLRLEEKLQVRAGDGGRVDKVGFGELGGQFLGKFNGVLFDLERGDLTIAREMSVGYIPL